jgi:hypothetical protein
MQQPAQQWHVVVAADRYLQLRLKQAGWRVGRPKMAGNTICLRTPERPRLLT